MQPNKLLGQNFLVNKGIIQKIIQSANLQPDDVVLEVGPGLGAITFELSKYVKKVIAIEKDKKLAEFLQKKISDENIKNVEIISDDVLKFLTSPCHPRVGGDPENNIICIDSLLQGNDREKYRIIANIPYYLTSRLIRILLELKQKPESIILTIQKEVAQRICAIDGKESLLSISVKFYANPKILFYVSKGSFAPSPKVDSAVIEITPKSEFNKISSSDFFKVVKAGFSAPKKMLFSNLLKTFKIQKEDLTNIFTKLNLDQKIRAEKLSVEQWIGLARELLLF